MCCHAVDQRLACWLCSYSNVNVKFLSSFRGVSACSASKSASSDMRNQVILSPDPWEHLLEMDDDSLESSPSGSLAEGTTLPFPFPSAADSEVFSELEAFAVSGLETSSLTLLLAAVLVSRDGEEGSGSSWIGGQGNVPGGLLCPLAMSVSIFTISAHIASAWRLSRSAREFRFHQLCNPILIETGLGIYKLTSRLSSMWGVAEARGWEREILSTECRGYIMPWEYLFMLCFQLCIYG